MIRFDNVSKRYDGGGDALSNLSFEIDRGEMAFLTGASGAGKSTLLRLIALIERPTRGQVVVDGQNIGRLSKRQVPPHRRKLGIVFQDNKLLPDRTTFDNVALPLIIAGVGDREIPRRVRAALDQVGLLKKENKPPRTLSTGEQQRVGIARAVVTRPRLLIADEPTGNLDPWLSLEIMKLFGRFNEIGVTMMIATHDLALLDRLNGRRLQLDNGVLVEPDDEALVF
ncbi:MAG: cell division ATP-binding protein FtsE [Chromatiales bacterium]|jgi:cell division transport system ATP-binding protein|nr:cell division ATP-binding protein FtsE [Chromatiales bacterium]MDP6150632.1 cell division ATP-binding protein FtsE [Gammaproteobacteria bacterium]MDP7093422.1 cell division ATP-binding protein FtsE [Gammaproteobacteria bacterium]MDP7271358.1 cell division ATP-binding protein FtsE [Gammaproteobacteria bacterium]HJP05153.1 cell division ATP-binding protein FtsE [Gammaproteobacteria bacterium]